MTFNEKLRHKMAHDRNPLLTTLADKVAVRDYVTRVVGDGYLAELHQVTAEPAELRKEGLPRRIVVKPSHGSGGCVVVADHASPASTLPDRPLGWKSFLVSPDSVDWDDLRAICGDWLTRRYQPWEWAYRAIAPRIMVEELLLHEGAIPNDYKVFVFHGRARLVQVDFDRHSNHVRTLYTPAWEPLPVAYVYPRGPEAVRPTLLDEMIAVAEALAGPVDFLRVDLYEVGDRIVVGELTNYPHAGTGIFTPQAFDRELGSWWSQPRRYA
jgi:hypothetical protein